MAGVTFKFDDNKLSEEDRKIYQQLNQDAKKNHPNVDEWIINLVNMNYVLNNCKDEDLTDEEREFRMNQYNTSQSIFETEKNITIKQIENNEILSFEASS